MEFTANGACSRQINEDNLGIDGALGGGALKVQLAVSQRGRHQCPACRREPCSGRPCLRKRSLNGTALRAHLDGNFVEIANGGLLGRAYLELIVSYPGVILTQIVLDALGDGDEVLGGRSVRRVSRSDCPEDWRGLPFWAARSGWPLMGRTNIPAARIAVPSARPDEAGKAKVGIA